MSDQQKLFFACKICAEAGHLSDSDIREFKDHIAAGNQQALGLVSILRQKPWKLAFATALMELICNQPKPDTKRIRKRPGGLNMNIVTQSQDKDDVQGEEGRLRLKRLQQLQRQSMPNAC